MDIYKVSSLVFLRIFLIVKLRMRQ